MIRKEYRALYYKNNAEPMKTKAKENYLANKAERIAQAKVWAQANPEKTRAANKKWAKKNPDKVFVKNKKHALSATGWTWESYQEAFAQQKGMCAICGKPSDRLLDADHEHIEPPKPRGLLCNAHNLMIGNAQDNPVILEAGAAYLRKWGK